MKVFHSFYPGKSHGLHTNTCLCSHFGSGVSEELPWQRNASHILYRTRYLTADHKTLYFYCIHTQFSILRGGSILDLGLCSLSWTKIGASFCVCS